MSDDNAPTVEPLPAGTSGVSTDEAQAFLLGRFGAAVTDVEPIGGGAWSKAYAFRRDGGHYTSAALPIPVVTEIGEALGGFYAISERAFGGFIDHLDGDGMRATLPSL